MNNRNVRRGVVLETGNNEPAISDSDKILLYCLQTVLPEYMSVLLPNR